MTEISPEGCIEFFRSATITVENYVPYLQLLVKPAYHDAFWVALDAEPSLMTAFQSIVDIIYQDMVGAVDRLPDHRIPALLFFFRAWWLYREGRYDDAHQGAHMAHNVISGYQPANKLLELTHDHIEQERIAHLELVNGRVAIDSIIPTPPEKLEMNPRWL